MRSFLVRRLGRIILVWLGITLVTFLLLRVTGDPARAVLGELASDAAVQEFRHLNGLDRPLVVQYISFVTGLLHGDFGKSLRYMQPILPILLERIPATLELAAASLAISGIFGVLIGIFAAVRRNSVWDYLARGLIMLGQGIPIFVLGLLLILLFGAKLHLLPTGGRGTWKNLLMPAFVLGFNLMSLTVRVTRSAVLDIIQQNYVRTARSKGLKEQAVLFRHVLRNAALPIASVLGVQTASLLSGGIITETIFSWPGVGRLLISAILGRDFTLVQSAVVVIATAVVLVNFLVDYLYSLLDPRIRFG
jgi:ABC-type dipeptide/oligopeptide/nickel transport system permease component